MTFTPGIYPIFKPKGPTSFTMIAQLRKITGIKTIGHTGTLDPLASGVLVVAIGREFTKKLDIIVQQEKEYVTMIKLGVTSTTDDEEGEKTVSELSNGENFPISQAQVQAVLPEFVGTIQQTPPIYSAIKIQGKPAHRRVRKGQTVTLQPRPVEIKSLELVSYTWPFLELKIVCGKGVYIRSLARDIGEILGTGAYMAELVRTRVGQFSLDEAIRLPEVG